MLRSKVITFVLVLFSLAFAFMSSYSPAIDRWLFDRYSLRWHVGQDLDKRTQTIALHNSAEVASPKIHVEVDLPPNVPHAVWDFDYSTFKSGEGASFLEITSYADSLKSLSKTDANKLAVAVDKHSMTRNLAALDAALNESFITDLQSKKVSESVVAAVRERAKGVKHSSMPCRGTGAAYEQCLETEGAVGRLEHSRRALQVEGGKRWQELTGVAVEQQGGVLSPSGKMSFYLSLGAGESGFLHIHYGPNVLKTFETRIPEPEGKQKTKVDTLADLRLPAWRLWLGYYPYFSFPVVALIILFLWSARDRLVPLRLRSTHKIFNHALKSDEHDDWELALQRYRYFILINFWLLCRTFRKSNVSLGPEEVLGFVRYSLRFRNLRHPTHYRDEGQLADAIRRKLEILVALA